MPQQQPLMRSRPSNSRNVTAIEPKVAWVRHAVNAAYLTHPENAQHGARNVISVEIKIISVHFVDQSKRASQMARNHHKAGAHQEVPKVRADGPGQDPEVDSQPEVPTV